LESGKKLRNPQPHRREVHVRPESKAAEISRALAEKMPRFCAGFGIARDTEPALPDAGPRPIRTPRDAHVRAA